MSATVETPAHLEVYARREIADGLIEFESAPKGWEKKDGTPRGKDHREYYWTPIGGDRTKYPSTTTLLRKVCPKDLTRWAEGLGIEGLVRFMDSRKLTAEEVLALGPEVTVKLVRDAGFGMEGTRDKAAARGLSVHGLLQTYMETGEAPKVFDHPEEHQGYIKALCRWLLKTKPEPVAVEQLVCHPEDGYAGRLDLRAMIGGRLHTIDLKTQKTGQIFREAHAQVGLYERAAVRCGEDPAEELTVLVLAANGEFRSMPANHPPDLTQSALDFYFACKPVDQACEAANRLERRARAAA